MTAHESPVYASVIFDADSTLAAIEGIDWLARQRGPELAREIASLTSRAMSGELPLERVYAARLDAIRPTRDEIARLARAYVDAVEPGALALCARLQAAGVHLAIVSGGVRDALLPLASLLGVHARDLHAVALHFDDNGVFDRLPEPQALTQQRGKVEIVQQLALVRPAVMVGDGSTDAAVASVVDAFIAYTRVARRPAVVHAAAAEAPDFTALEALLLRHDG